MKNMQKEIDTDDEKCVYYLYERFGDSNKELDIK